MLVSNCFYSYINQRVELLKQAAEQIEVVQKYEHSEMKVKGYLQIEKKISFIVHTNDSPDIILNELNKQFERMGWTISKVDRNYYGFRAYNDNYGFIAGPIMKKSKITGKEEFENDWLVIFYYNNFLRGVIFKARFNFQYNIADSLKPVIFLVIRKYIYCYRLVVMYL